MSRLGPGELVSGKYRIVRLIGDGGMGVVYEARHEVLGSSVALKFLHADLAKRPGLTQRFLQEARVSATIQSPHVTHVTDVDTAQDGSPYLVMELLSGQSLQGLLDRQGKLPLDQAVDFALQILAGLEAAHATGVVHRDMKPDNVFVTPTGGGPLLKLIDFGIAKLRASSEFSKGLTRAGVVMGTPEYMAPEQLISAHTTDHRADIYSLGVMLFEMLAGCRPADGDDAEVIVAAVQAGRVRRLPDLVPGLPEGLVALIERATLPEREQRFESAAAMRLALAPFAGQLSHAGRLAATAEPMAPLPTPASQALLSLPPHVTNAGVPKTLPPEGPPLSVSQLGSARTSISEGEPVMSQMARPTTGTAMGGASPYGPPPGSAPAYGYAGAPLAQQPVPAHKKSRSGLLISALVVAVLAGGGAVGYAAYNAADRRVVPPPLPAPDLPTAKPTTEVLTGEGPADLTGMPPTPTPARPPGGRLPSGTGAGGSGAGGAGNASGGSGQVVIIANGGSTTVQFPFPLPSTLQIPTSIPSTIQLPPGITFPPGFPGVPQQPPATTPTPTAAPTTTPTAAPTTTPTAAPTTPPTTRPRTSAKP
ncbi:MAG TPA: protein kinase [Polyangiaceae bacterium]|nr:protein kinase [Polyangiaceae bacterium]